MAAKTWFDSHVHLDWYKIEQVPATLDAAEKAGVGKICTVARSVISSAANVWISQRYANVYAGIAIHPLWPDPLDNSAYQELKAMARDKNVVCIGESGIGLGSGRDPVRTIQVTPEAREEQRKKFARHIRLGREMGLPVVIHNDMASGADIAEVFEKEKGTEAGGVTHATMMDVNDCRRLWEMGVYISIGPQINRPGWELLEAVARQVPEDRFVIETDSAGGLPDGTRNPDKLLEVAKKVAAVRGITMEKLRQITVRNTNKLYHIAG